MRVIVPGLRSGGRSSTPPFVAQGAVLFFFFFNLFILFLFIYYFRLRLGLRCRAQDFSSCGERGLLFVAVHGLLIAVASLVVEHGL